MRGNGRNLLVRRKRLQLGEAFAREFLPGSRRRAALPIPKLAAQPVGHLVEESPGRAGAPIDAHRLLAGELK